MPPPLHLRVFVRDLALTLKFGPDGDLCQAAFEDFVLHNDEKNPLVKRGHYVRTVAQIRQCLDYVEYCQSVQPKSLTETDPFFPLSPDSSRFVFNLQTKVDGEDNVSLKPETLAAFWEQRGTV